MNVPNLRFPEFKDEWLNYKLNTLVDRIQTKNKNGDCNRVLTISAQYGLVDQVEFFNRNVSSSNLTGYYLLNNGQFAYNKSYSKGYPWGAVKRLDKYNEGVLSSLYICFNTKESSINSDYLTHYFESTKWHHQVSEIAVEGARNHGLLNIGVSDFFATLHNIPSLKEQAKIAKFLNLIERKIQTQMKIIEEYRLLKKTIISAILPNNTSNLPNYRSKEFSDAWTEYKVKDIFTITRGSVLSSNDTSKIMDNNNIYPVYSSQTLNSGLLGYYSSYLYENAITWTTDGANAGTVTFRKGKFYCTNVCGVLLENKMKPSIMVAEVLNKISKQYVSYVGNPKLMNNVMANILIKLPVNLQEQKKISSVFKILDNTINLNKYIYNEYLQLKYYFLQKMFI